MKKGYLISFEGIDGSGKTTLSRMLYEHLLKEGHKVSLYRDPGSTELAENIRKLILENDMDPTTELLLFEAARSSLVWEKILPDLREGKIILLDRFIDSTVVYQGFGKEINLGTVNILNHISTRSIKPDLTIIINIPLEKAVERLKTSKSRFEQDLEYLRKVRDAYFLLPDMYKERRYAFVDGSRELQEVFEEVKNLVLSLIND
ncbi:dTMP kinase [Thermocrinis minervae]|uniref:Thymidylate kinase n=1 Tax=Thermocrinis minervae TaxID=381751 RepID=A0A1M6S4E3_9AQUI|nr:dTMP kinase [Thermocrinis minervae]SHK39662.1 dTMP kinase [Thermocrinis minervae]